MVKLINESAVPNNRLKMLLCRIADKGMSASAMHRLFCFFLDSNPKINLFEDITYNEYEVYTYGTYDFMNLGKEFEQYLASMFDCSVTNEHRKSNRSYIVTFKDASKTFVFTFRKIRRSSSDADIYVRIDEVI